MSKNDIEPSIDASAIHENLFWAILSYFLGYNSQKRSSLKLGIVYKTGCLDTDLLEWNKTKNWHVFFVLRKILSVN